MTEATGSAQGESVVGAGGGYDGRSTGAATGESVVAARSNWIELYAGEAAVETLFNTTNNSLNLGEFAVLTAGQRRAEFLDGDQLAALTLSQIAAKELMNTSLPVLVAGQAEPPTMDTSQIAVLTLARANPDRRTLRAWFFWQDGHKFYVLHLGDTGTVVFDTTTRKWSEWQSHLYNIWRANYGVNWNEDVVAGSVDSNVIFQVRPDTATDLGQPIVSRITGGYPMRMRGSLTVDEVMVTSSLGISLPVGEATMELRGSDDNGVSWTSYGALDLGDGTPKTQVSWRSLGIITAPGRVFELIDNGAARRINSLKMFTRDAD